MVLPDTDDSVDAHVADTLAAGAGLCDPDAVRSIVADGYRAVAELVDDGARFDEAAPGQWALTREGGHSRRRIIHAGGDATGRRGAAGARPRRGHAGHPRAITSRCELLHDDGAVTGVLVLNDDGLGIVHAPSVILATGGLGHLYTRDHQPRGLDRRRRRAGAVGRRARSATSSSSSSTRPCCSTAMRAAGAR